VGHEKLSCRLRFELNKAGLSKNGKGRDIALWLNGSPPNDSDLQRSCNRSWRVWIVLAHSLNLVHDAVRHYCLNSAGAIFSIMKLNLSV